MFKFRRTSVAALAAAAAVPGLLTVAAAPASAAPAPYTIALITSVTGEAAPQDVGTVGAFKARLDLQNAQGGIDGHKLEPLIIDDQTSPTAISTAIQDAISKGAIGIVSESPVLFLAAKVAAAAGIPVTGDDSDGPEWGQPGYTNMFAAVYGSLNPSYPVNTVYGQLLEDHRGHEARYLCHRHLTRFRSSQLRRRAILRTTRGPDPGERLDDSVWKCQLHDPRSGRQECRRERPLAQSRLGK